MTVTSIGPLPTGFPAPKAVTLAGERLRLVIYGDPKVGKTTLAGSFPRPLFIDFDRGLESLAVQNMEAEQWPPPDYDGPIGFKQLEQLYEYIRQHRDRWDTLIFDSLTVIQQALLNEIVDSRRDTNTTTDMLRLMVPEIGEYQGNMRQLERILVDFRRFNKHMVVIAGVRERLGKRSPNVSPSVGTILSHWASVIAELTVEDVQGGKARVLWTSPGPGREAGSRFRSLEPYMQEPTFDKIWAKVRAEYGKAQAASEARKQAAKAAANTTTASTTTATAKEQTK